MNKLVLLNISLIFVLTLAVMFYTFGLINDTICAAIVVPIFVYFVIIKERAVVRPSNKLKKEYRQKDYY